jgi:hypothetical protein
VSIEPRAVLLLTFEPAAGLMFSVPADAIPPFVAFGCGPLARYEREPGDGDVIRYRFSLDDFPSVLLSGNHRSDPLRVVTAVALPSPASDVPLARR